MLELRCGSGELTAALSGLGHDVIATDPSAQLVARLGHTVPNARLAVARPEDLPFPASSVDIVAAASGDVDAERALPEVARVLRPGGILAVIRSSGDPKVPWVRKVLALVGVGSTPAPDNPFESSDLFTLTERRSFRRWQQFFRPTLVAFVADSPKATMLSQADRADLLDEAGALYDSYGRGPDGLLMPWVVDCYRARVQGKTGVVTADVTDDGLLIDFF
ncbi:MAG: class I SAM-dependent methyltransferase [Propionibacteriales bacterium]|nr:class I SAM-dependent methyltransferase [Propionibacteriales bacterium]